MREFVTLNVKGLMDSCSRSRYNRDFGIYCNYLNHDKNGEVLKRNTIGYELVTDENPKFICLFGLFVDVVSGDIALGMFPEVGSYICVGNIYKLLAESFFDSDNLPYYIDGKYMLESMKISSSVSSANLVNEINDMYNECVGNITDFSSIILNLTHSVEEKRNPSKEITYFNESCAAGRKCIIDFIRSCVEMLFSLEKVAVGFFGAFISERNYDEVFDGIDSTGNLCEAVDSSTPNLERLFAMYLKQGVPVEFLKALKSYGLGIKQRKGIYSSIFNGNSSFLLYSSADSLSSLCYLVDKVSVGKNIDTINCMSLTFNILDLLGSSGWDSSLFFSLELISGSRNRSLYDTIVDRFNISSILLENKVSEKDFVMNVDLYCNSILHLIDRGSLYTRKVLPTQYSMMSFSPHQIERSGRVFEKLSKMILKNF